MLFLRRAAAATAATTSTAAAAAAAPAWPCKADGTSDRQDQGRTQR
jgi:hypothetical protein